MKVNANHSPVFYSPDEKESLFSKRNLAIAHLLAIRRKSCLYVIASEAHVLSVTTATVERGGAEDGEAIFHPFFAVYRLRSAVHFAGNCRYLRRLARTGG